MCWLYVPGLEASNSDSTSLVPGAVSSVTWRGKLRALQSWRHVWRTATYLRRLSGLTSPPSMLQTGADAWIASLRDFRASHGPSPESGSEPRMNAGFGPRSSASFATWNHASSIWRMSQGSLFEDLDLFLGPWPRSGSVLNGEAIALPAWAPRTSGNEYSSWPTVTVNGNDNEAKAWSTPTAADHQSIYEGTHGNLREDAARWHTPRACADKMGKPRENDRDDLQAQAQAWATWPTPVASDSNRQSESYIRGNPTLLGAAREAWPTPTARDHRSGLSNQHENSRPLNEVATRWPTPDASVSLGFNQSDSPGATIRPALAAKARQITTHLREREREMISGRLDPQETGAESTPPSGLLNPAFVGWLMGFPPGWTSSGPSEMEFAHWLQRLRSELSRLAPGSEA